MTIRLEAGKKYRNRSGEVVGPMAQDSSGCFLFDLGTWYPDGVFSQLIIDCPLDLIEEVIEEPVKKPHKHAELIKKWADGNEIQALHIVGNDWIDIKNPAWGSPDFKYRIKPQEVPQWRKDLAEKMKAGGVLEARDDDVWVKAAASVEVVLDSSRAMTEALYRIKPEQKPDVVQFSNIYEGGFNSYLSLKTANSERNYNRLAVLKTTITFNGDTPNLPTVEVISHEDALKMGEKE